MEPKYIIEEYIECDTIIGWVRAIYSLHEGKDRPQFVYGIEEPESETIFFFTDDQLQ